MSIIKTYEKAIELARKKYRRARSTEKKDLYYNAGFYYAALLGWI